MSSVRPPESDAEGTPATNASADLEQRILLRAATAKDALMTVAVLQRAGIVVHPCASVPELIEELRRGAGAVLLAEESLTPTAAPLLAAALQAQPSWSDLPVLVLARQGADSRTILQAMDTAANVTVIERPVRVASLVSSVRSAMRARARQYDLRATLEGLRLADQRKTEFLATLAHELRNPLAPLLTALTLLGRKRPEPDDATRYYDMMRRQVDHMVRLVDDLMEVSRITRGKIALDMARVDLQQVLADATELSRPQIDSARHRLELLLPAEPLPLQGDRVRLTQVFSNLLNNAAKYTTGPGHITVAARRDGDAVEVSVSDNGMGIAPDMLDSIFDMFVQVSSASKAAQGGLGIGLTLVKSLVELHGGTVWARSDGLGHGSCFGVRLQLVPQAASAPGATAPLPNPHPATAMTALVVDDNHDAADSLAEFLESFGITASVAYSGPEALQLLASVRPRLAILDIGMPGMDGCELARRMRREPAGADSLLVALTGWGQQRDRDATAAAGFDHHLVKPIDVGRLLPILDGLGATGKHG